MQEQWKRWEPINHLKPKYEIDSFCLTDGYGTIVLFDINNQNKKIELQFTNLSNTIFKKSNDDLTFNKIKFLKEKYGTQFYEEWSFFIIINSFFIEWLAIESPLIGYMSNKFTHFAIITPTTIFDIVSIDEPKIKLL